MNDKKERVIQAVVLKMVAVFSIDEHSVWMNLVSTVLLQKFPHSSFFFLFHYLHLFISAQASFFLCPSPSTSLFSSRPFFSPTLMTPCGVSFMCTWPLESNFTVRNHRKVYQCWLSVTVQCGPIAASFMDHSLLTDITE